MQGFGFSCFDADIGMPWVASHRISHDACCWMWGGCCTAGLALSALMAVPSGLGLPVLRWSRSRLWRGSGIRWTGIVSPLPVRPCPAPACNTGIGHRRAPAPQHPATSDDIGRAYGRGFPPISDQARARAMASISGMAPGHPADIGGRPRPAGLPISFLLPRRYRWTETGSPISAGCLQGTDTGLRGRRADRLV